MSIAGHNTQLEQWEEQQFLNALGQINTLNSEMAGTKGEIGGIYKRLADATGMTKADFKWAMELQTKDSAEVIATMERRLKVARWLGHRISRQLEMFDTDRTPADDVAYTEGYTAGKLRKDNANPYDPSSPKGQRWQSGFNDGTAFINQDLAAAVNGAGFDEGDPLAKAAAE